MSVRIIATLDERMAAFERLAPEVRVLLDFGPLNPDSVFDALRMQNDLGPRRAARKIREIIADMPLTWAGSTGRNWTPERLSPLK